MQGAPRLPCQLIGSPQNCGAWAAIITRSGLMPGSISASHRKRPKCCVAANDVKGHVWTVPAVQEEFDLSAKRSGAAMYAACFSRRGLPRRDAAAVAAGPDVIR